MAGIFRATPDGFKYSADSPGSKQRWIAYDTEDPEEVDTLIGIHIPAFDEFDNPFVDADPEYQGGSIWVIEARFGQIPPLGRGLTQWEFDTSGGKEKKYQSIQTNFSLAATGFTLTNYQGAIGQTETSVEGVEVVVPTLTGTAKRKYVSTGLAPDLPSDYIEELEELTGHTNEAQFVVTWMGQTLTFEVGEALFLGAVITQTQWNEIEIDYKFAFSRNRLIADGDPVILVNFGPISKFGHDYAWLAYGRSTDAASHSRIEVAKQINCEQVYDEGDFTILVV